MLKQATVLQVGAGGLGSEIGHCLVRKGIGRLVICDHDVVELSNLNRQRFIARDMYEPKALALARNLAGEGFLGTTCVGQAVGFLPETAELLADGIDVAVVGVDNNATRCLASQFFGRRGIPVVFCALNEEANFGWIFVQTARRPCIACLFPFMADALRMPEPCRESPAVIDIVKQVSGLVSYAAGSLLLDLRRCWNYYDLNLVGDATNCIDRIRPRPGCHLCDGAIGEA